MPTTDPQLFLNRFGYPPPNALLEFVGDQDIRALLPVSFKLKGVGFTVEIQYLLDIEDPKSYNSNENRLAFAVTTDGYELSVDLTSDTGNILQDEFGDVDSLDVLIKDLLDAEKSSLS
ncbi:MAG: hypothetical protein AB8B55_10885 [Mariniblastus sp.]